MTLSTPSMDPVTTIAQNFYKAPLPHITLEFVELASLTSKSVSRLVTTLGEGTRLGIAASYGEKCVLETLAFSTAIRVLFIMVRGDTVGASRQKKILREELLCNVSLEKHGFFMERIAASLYLDLGLYIRNAFDIASAGDKRGSMAAYKGVLVRAQTLLSLNERVVERTFAEQPFILSRIDDFALRAWACYIGVQAFPDSPGAIDTSAKNMEARSNHQSSLVSI
jgi:hypothetical protein